MLTSENDLITGEVFDYPEVEEETWVGDELADGKEGYSGLISDKPGTVRSEPEDSDIVGVSSDTKPPILKSVSRDMERAIDGDTVTYILEVEDESGLRSSGLNYLAIEHEEAGITKHLL